MNEASCVQVERESDSQDPDDGLRRHQSALQNIQTSPWRCKIPPSSTQGHGLPLMTRARGHLAAPIWNWSVKPWVTTSRRVVSDRISTRSGSDRDTGRRLGQFYIHIHPSVKRLIDKPRRPSNTMFGQRNPDISKGKLEACLDVQPSKSRVLSQLFYLHPNREANPLAEVAIHGILKFEARLLARWRYFCPRYQALISIFQRHITNVLYSGTTSSRIAAVQKPVEALDCGWRW